MGEGEGGQHKGDRFGNEGGNSFGGGGKTCPPFPLPASTPPLQRVRGGRGMVVR